MSPDLPGTNSRDTTDPLLPNRLMKVAFQEMAVGSHEFSWQWGYCWLAAYMDKVRSALDRKARAQIEQQQIDELLSIDIAGPQSRVRQKRSHHLVSLGSANLAPDRSPASASRPV